MPLVFHPNEHTPSFNFQKAHRDDFAFYFNSHCPSAGKYSSLSLSSASALFTSLTLNATKSSIPLGRIVLKPGGPLKCKKPLVKDVRLLLQLIHVMKIVRLKFPLPDMLRLSSPRLRHGRRLALLSRLNLTLNWCTLSFVLSPALLPHIHPLRTFSTVPLPGSRLRSSPIT